MKVVIVAKTRQGSRACIGAVSFDGRSLRLVSADAEQNEMAGMEYNIGEVWALEHTLVSNILPPHTENVCVHGKRRLPPLAQEDLIPFIETHFPIHTGGLDQLYAGLTQATSNGALYIAERTGIPSHSTCFWRPDQPLERVLDSKRVRYRYPTAEGGRTLTFVGFQDPVPELPAGTLLRVSLAHWWRPSEMPEGELRCFVQLSGWFIQEHVTAVSAPPVAPDLAPPPPITRYASHTEALQRVFGYHEFRPLQEEIVHNALAGRDGLVVMPTGSGKSLCYQLPALLWDGLTVVVSPLISLMEDQVSQLRELGIPSAFLNSTLRYADYLATMNWARDGRLKLLYAAPETLVRPEILLLLEQCHIACLTIDEAHCISQWGHDFRPEYRQLAAVRQRLPQAVCLALTATATPRVRQDILESLHIPQAQAFLASFNRENLFLAVQPKQDVSAQILDFVANHAGESGIIYCATRQQVEDVTTLLTRHGHSVRPYHAGLPTPTRQQNQRDFIRDDVPIMVATIAFGMGINKPNVRFVLHVDLPQDLESYYQQIGRAGRDGLPAHCLLLYSYGDVSTVNFFIGKMAADQQRGASLRLAAMVRYAEAGVCRRRPLLAYFGETDTADSCTTCDNCHAEQQPQTDLTIPAQKFLSCIYRTEQLFGVSYIVDVLRGSRQQKILENRHDQLSVYGIGTDWSKGQWRQLATQLIQQEIVAQDLTYGSLKLTPKAWEVLRGQAPMWGVMVEERIQATAASSQPALPHNPTLFEQLRRKRKELADEANLPPYAIFHDRTLMEMATFYPHSADAFANLTGVGQRKLETYADQFLPLIRQFCAANGLAEVAYQSTPSPRSSAKPQGVQRRVRAQTAEEMLVSGRSMADICAAIGVQPSTVVGYLLEVVREGRPLPPAQVRALSSLPPAQQERVLACFAELGSDALRPVFDAMEEAVSYSELHIMRLLYLCGGQKTED